MPGFCWCCCSSSCFEGLGRWEGGGGGGGEYAVSKAAVISLVSINLTQVVSACSAGIASSKHQIPSRPDEKCERK